MSLRTQKETELERTARVLSTPPITVEPAVANAKLQALLDATGPVEKKLEKLAELMREAVVDARFKQLELVHKEQLAEQERRFISGVDSSAVAGARRVARTRQVTPGTFINKSESADHPMMRTAQLIKMMLTGFVLFLFAEPIFVVMSSDMQAMSIAFFVMTLLIGLFTGMNYVELREQELLLYYGEPEQPEQRNIRLVYSLSFFGAALFIQLIYALVAARFVVPTYVVVFETLTASVFVVLAHRCVAAFENAYEADDV